MKPFSRHQINPSVLSALAIVLVFAVTGFSLYSNTFGSPFVFDDITRIKENPNIRLTQFNLKEILKVGFGKSAAKSRPIGNISIALNYYFHQYNPKGYHIVNIIIHIVTGILLFYFLRTTLTLPSVKSRYNQPSAIAFFAALVWLAHPIQTQSVTYIIQRLNSLAALFFVLAFYLYLKGRLADRPARQWSWFGSAALAWLLALGCKQNAATLPFFIFVYEWYFFQDFSTKWLKSNLKILLVVVILFSVLALVYLGFEPWEKIKKLKDFSQGEFTWGERLLTQGRVVIYYLSLIFFPHPSRLNLDYDFPLSHSLFDPVTTLLAVIAIIGLVALALYMAKREPIVSFCLLWFFGNLVIESSIIPLAIIFEHRLYLPSMLFCLLPVVLLFRYVKIDWLKIGLLAAVVIVFSVWTYQRNAVWQNEVSLWGDVVKKSPNKARPHLNLGEGLAGLGKTKEAIEHYTRALRIKPGYAKAHFNLGNAMERQGKYAEAIKYYTAAIQNDPGYIKAGNNLGLALAKQGKWEEAIKHYLEILKIQPHNVQIHLNIGVVLTEHGEIDQAISHFQQALDIDSDDAAAHYNLAIALEMQQKITDAVGHYLAALEKNPDNALAHFNVANIFLRQGKMDEAVIHYEKSLAIQPDFPQALNNLALVYAKNEEYANALSELHKMLNYWPDKAEIYYNIACMYSRLARVDESIAWLKKALGKGYTNWGRIKTDSHLDNIRDAAAYKDMIKGH